MFLKPQLAQTIQNLGEFPLPREKYVMEPKYDGWRVLAHRWHECGANGVEYYTRSGKLLDGNMPQFITDELLNFPPDTLLDGELYHFLGRDKIATALRGRESQNLRYVAFDVLQFADHNARGVPLHVRRKLYKDVLDAAQAQHVHAIHQYPATSAVYATVKQGFEGVVLKPKDSLYYSGKRKDWLKLKPVQTTDMKVERIERADPGLIFYGDGRKCYSSTALASLVQVGDTIEVRHDGITKDGNFLFPRLERIRDDL